MPPVFFPVCTYNLMYDKQLIIHTINLIPHTTTDLHIKKQRPNTPYTVFLTFMIITVRFYMYGKMDETLSSICKLVFFSLSFIYKYSRGQK